MNHQLGDVLGLIFVLAAIYVLARRNSMAPQFIQAFGDALDGVVKFAVSG